MKRNKDVSRIVKFKLEIKTNLTKSIFQGKYHYVIEDE